MKKKALCIALAAVATVSAAAVIAETQTKEAIVTAFQFVVKGEKKEAPEMVVIDDRTYVPLRAMGDLLGVEVDWDEATRSVLIAQNEAPRAEDLTSSFSMNDGVAEGIARLAVENAFGKSILEGATTATMEVAGEYQVAFMRDDVEGYLLVRIGKDGRIISISAEASSEETADTE